MTKMMKRGMYAMLGLVGLSLLLSIPGCSRDDDKPTHPVHSEEVLNYYVSGGEQEGLINGVLYETVGVIALPDGTWRIRYQVSSGTWWHIVVRSEGQQCHSIGTHEKIDNVTVQSGTHPSSKTSGLLEDVSVTTSQWQPLTGSEEQWVFQDGVLASWITPMDRQAFCPQGQPVSELVCSGGGVSWFGLCWYLSDVSQNCTTTCQTANLNVNVAVDAGGNFWDARTDDECKTILTQLGANTAGLGPLSTPSTYGLCGADAGTGIVIRIYGGAQSATASINGAQVACPCQ